MQGKRLIEATVIGVTALVFLLATVYCVAVHSTQLVVICGLAGLAVVLLPFIIYKLFKTRVAWQILLVVSLHAIASIIIGNVFDGYGANRWFDKIVHGYYGFTAAFVSFHLIVFAFRGASLKHKFLLAVFGAVTISIASGMVWEIYEFTVDSLCNANMQRYIPLWGEAVDIRFALMDTMLDMVSNLIGAIALIPLAVFARSTRLFTSGVVKEE